MLHEGCVPKGHWQEIKESITFLVMKDEILGKLSKHLFWDYDINILDPNLDKKLILERVFSCGTEKDEKTVFDYYGKEVIKNTVLEINTLDKKTVNYLSIVLGTHKEEFKCYKKSLSTEPFGIL